MRTLKIPATAVLCVIGIGANAQNLLTNGNFETGTLAGWTNSGTVNVYSLMGVGNSFAAVFPAINAGLSGDIFQSVATQLNGSYTFSFDLKGQASNASGFGTPDAPIVSSEFMVKINNTPQLLDLTNSVNFGFNHYSFSLNGTGTTKIEFKAFWTGGSYRLDNISLVNNAPPPPTTATPEPGTWAMLSGLLTIGGLTARRRKRIA